MKKHLIALCAAMLAASALTMTAFAEDVPSPTNPDKAPATDGTAVTVDTNGPVSPQTGDNSVNGWAIGALAFAGVAAVTFSKARKSDSN